MSKYLKKFDTHTEYNTYINGQDAILPNVSYCEDNNEVHYNPYFELLIVKYNVTDTSAATQLYFYSPQEGLAINGALMFDKVEIDNVEVSISDIDTAKGKYQFSTSGEHVAKYTLKDPTIIGAELDMSTGQPIRIGAIFSSCTTITEIKLPNSVTHIGNSTFIVCTGLTNITIPSSVTSIDESAFYGCSGLASITIPNSVTSIGNYAFSGCTGLTSIIVDNNNSTYDSRDNCNAIIETATNKLIAGCKNTIIPNTVTSIAEYIFVDNLTLTNITIPSSVTSIGDNAFAGCSSLTSVIVEATTPPTLGSYAFDNNASGRKIYVPSESVNAYKAASGWSTYASDIEAIS